MTHPVRYACKMEDLINRCLNIATGLIEFFTGLIFPSLR